MSFVKPDVYICAHLEVVGRAFRDSVLRYASPKQIELPKGTKVGCSKDLNPQLEERNTVRVVNAYADHDANEHDRAELLNVLTTMKTKNLF